MIIIVSTPLRIAASYFIACAMGAVLYCQWLSARDPICPDPAEANPDH